MYNALLCVEIKQTKFLGQLHLVLNEEALMVIYMNFI